MPELRIKVQYSDLNDDDNTKSDQTTTTAIELHCKNLKKRGGQLNNHGKVLHGSGPSSPAVQLRLVGDFGLKLEQIESIS